MATAATSATDGCSGIGVSPTPSFPIPSAEVVAWELWHALEPRDRYVPPGVAAEVPGILWIPSHVFETIELQLSALFPRLMAERPLKQEALRVVVDSWMRQTVPVQQQQQPTRDPEVAVAFVYEVQVRAWVANFYHPWLVLLRAIRDDWVEGATNDVVPFIWGFMQPEGVNSILGAQEPGTYVFRFSTTSPRAITVTVRMESDPAVSNFRILAPTSEAGAGGPESLWSFDGTTPEGTTTTYFVHSLRDVEAWHSALRKRCDLREYFRRNG